MIRVSKEFTFDAAHRLQGHDRACQFLHGHTWRVQVMVDAPKVQESGSSRGMVIDFAHLKAGVHEVVAMFDHSVILEEGDPLIELLEQAGQRVVEVPYRPTAENFAMAIRKVLGVARVRVYETPNNYAEDFDA